jgi:hypothetical protein
MRRKSVAASLLFSVVLAAAAPADGQEAPDDGGDWIRKREPDGAPAPADAPRIVEPGEDLRGASNAVGDATVTEVKLKTYNVVPVDMKWAGDAASFYCLNEAGDLRQVGVPDLRELRRLEIGKRCRALAASSAGLLVNVSELQELWVIDPAKLSVLRKIPVGSVVAVTASPATPVAFAGRHDHELKMIDTVGGKVLGTLDARRLDTSRGRRHPDGRGLREFRRFRMTPDGRHLLVENFNCLHRFLLNGTRLVYEQGGPAVGYNPWRIEVSPDSRRVAIPSGEGNRSVRGHPKIADYGTYVYAVTDLSRPVLSVIQGDYPRAMAFDTTAGRIYSQNKEYALITFDAAGRKLREYGFTKLLDNVVEMLAHPRGHRVLIRTDTRMFWVELPGAPALAARAPAPAPPKAGDDDWIGKTRPGAKPAPRVPPPGGAAPGPAGPPAAVETGDALAAATRTVVDASVTALKLDAEDAVRQDMRWAKDGRSFYFLHKSGLLRQVGVPGLKELRRLEIKKRCTTLAASGAGLLVHVGETQELWVVDPAKLSVLRRIPVGNVITVASSPRTAMAFAGRNDGQLKVIDTAGGKLLAHLDTYSMKKDRARVHLEGNGLTVFKWPEVTPDGRYLLAESFGSLHRFRIERARLVYEEGGPDMGGSNPQRIEISPDSRHVALLSGGGNREDVPGHPPIGPYGTYIYRVADLMKPTAVVNQGAYPCALGFDVAAGRLYSQNHDRQLITFEPDGTKLKEYALAPSERVAQLLVHPRGHRLLVRTDKRVYWVELPGAPVLDGQAAPAPAPKPKEEARGMLKTPE